MSPARERFLTSHDDLQLFFRDWGDEDAPAAPVLCLPGLTRNSLDFATLAGRLAKSRRIICPDLRGRGRSARAADWRSYDAAFYLDDIRHLLAALGIAKVVVVGTSMGGLLGTALAAAMPTALAGLVINDVGPDIAPGGAGRILDYVGRDRPVADWPAAVSHLRQMFRTLSLETEEDWLSFAQGTFRKGPDGLLHFDWDPAIVRPIVHPASPPPDLWNLWRAVRRIPTLAIRGEASDILTAETFARMKSEKPDLVQATIPGVGHCPTLNEPIAVEAVNDFFRSL